MIKKICERQNKWGKNDEKDNSWQKKKMKYLQKGKKKRFEEVAKKLVIQ